MKLEDIVKSIKRQSTKQNHELIWSYTFVYHINKQRGSDYEVEEGPNDITDVYAVSKSGQFSNLKLQLTWAKEKNFNFKIKRKILNFSTDNILEAVDRKFKKYNNQGKFKEVKEIVLLIQGDLPEGWQDKIYEDEKKLKKIKQYPFLGIYYISPPVSRSTGLSNGFIASFKEII